MDQTCKVFMKCNFSMLRELDTRDFETFPLHYLKKLKFCPIPKTSFKIYTYNLSSIVAVFVMFLICKQNHHIVRMYLAEQATSLSPSPHF